MTGADGRYGESPRTAVAIGAGVAGLATAAFLGREGLAVTVYESNAVTGAGTGVLTVGDAPGFRLNTGPSWSLIPDAFDHFFRFMGTLTEDELDLVTLDPAYRIYPEALDPLDVPEWVKSFERIEPGAGDALDRYLESAADAYRIAVAGSSTRPPVGSGISRQGRPQPPAAARDPVDNLPRCNRVAVRPGTRGSGRFSPTRRCSSAPGPAPRRPSTT